MLHDKVIAEVLAKAGGATAIAAAVGGEVKRQNVEYWLKRQEFPSEHCPALERAYGIPCERLRGDVKWVRVPAVGWPKGKPLIDVLPARPAAKAA